MERGHGRPWDSQPEPKWCPSPHWLSLATQQHHSLFISGVYFPALASLLSQRVPEGERAFTYSIVGAGSQFG